jgi:rhodanese-related sulfurtransferase
MKNLRASELSGLLAGDEATRPVVLDVREPWEYAICHLPDSVHIPMQSIPARIDELDMQGPIVCVCHHGSRSLQVCQFLLRSGFQDVGNLTGGLDAWSREVDPSLPTY